MIKFSNKNKGTKPPNKEIIEKKSNELSHPVGITMIKLLVIKIAIIISTNNNHMSHHKKSNKIKNNKILILHMMTMMITKMTMIKMITTTFFKENNSLRLWIVLKYPTNKFHYLPINNHMADWNWTLILKVIKTFKLTQMIKTMMMMTMMITIYKMKKMEINNIRKINAATWNESVSHRPSNSRKINVRRVKRVRKKPSTRDYLLRLRS